VNAPKCYVIRTLPVLFLLTSCVLLLRSPHGRPFSITFPAILPIFFSSSSHFVPFPYILLGSTGKKTGEAERRWLEGSNRGREGTVSVEKEWKGVVEERENLVYR
jgi:hypothetical protein